MALNLWKTMLIECRARLAGPNPTQEVLDIVENNIVHQDALTYHYEFGAEKERALTFVNLS